MYIGHMSRWLLYYRGMRGVRNPNGTFLRVYIQLYIFGILILQEWNSKDLTAAITYIIILISLTFNIFIFCYIGELVAEQVRPYNRKICKSLCTLILTHYTPIRFRASETSVSKNT